MAHILSPILGVLWGRASYNMPMRIGMGALWEIVYLRHRPLWIEPGDRRLLRLKKMLLILTDSFEISKSAPIKAKGKMLWNKWKKSVGFWDLWRITNSSAMRSRLSLSSCTVSRRRSIRRNRLLQTNELYL